MVPGSLAELSFWLSARAPAAKHQLTGFMVGTMNPFMVHYL
jgi:hypothetical protein